MRGRVVGSLRLAGVDNLALSRLLIRLFRVRQGERSVRECHSSEVRNAE